MTQSINKDENTSLIGESQTRSIYDLGFDYFEEKRTLAKTHGALWLLSYQLKQLKQLKLSAQVGLFWTCTYAFAVGSGLAGYFVVLMGVDLITHGWGWFLLLIPIVAGIFSGLLNFWVARKEPTEMGFDLMKREDAADLSFTRKCIAWLLALTFSALLTAACAYGMWEFFGAVMDTEIAWVHSLKVAITSVLATILFIPELSICLKFNKKWLRKTPVEHYENLCAAVDHDTRYIFAYVACLSCVLVGAVFTALAMADMVSSVIPFDAAAALLTIASLTGISFYADKAYTQVTAQLSQSHSAGVHLTRTMNALGNAVPAFLGGFIVGGFWLGLFTGLCGFTTSFLSGAEGKRDGYENTIEKEITKTKEEIDSLARGKQPHMAEPYIQSAQGDWMPVTQHASLFTPFYRTKTTQDFETEILKKGVVAKPLS